MNVLDSIFPARRLGHSIAELLQQVWIMEPGAVEGLLAELQTARAQLVASGQLRASLGAGEDGEEAPLEVVDGVARIRLEGPIVKQVPGWARYYGVRMAGAQDVQIQLARAMADGNVRSVLLVIDSPGGTLAGVQELADAIYAARAAKPVWTYGSDLVASAAIWVGSQASRFSANRAAQIGSIGVYAVAIDASRFYESAGIKVTVVRAGDLKGAGTWGAPITDAQLASWQAMVDGAAALFVEAVARGRGLAVEEVQKLATGATWYALEAKGLGLIDAVESLDVAHAACAQALITDEPDAEPEEPPSDDEPGELDDVEEDARSAATSAPPISTAAPAATSQATAPTGAEGTQEAMTIKASAGAPATPNTLDQAQARIAELERELALSERERALATKAGTEDRKTAAIEAAISEGRLAPAMRGDAEAYADACGANVERLERFLGALQGSGMRAPRGQSPQRPAERAGATSGADASRADRQVATRLGVSLETMEASGQVHHFTADGKVVMRDGSVKGLKSFAPLTVVTNEDEAA